MTARPMVIKIGGSLADPAGLLDDVAAHGAPLVIVHGAHRVLDDLSARLGHAPRFVTSASGTATGTSSRTTSATSSSRRGWSSAVRRRTSASSR